MCWHPQTLVSSTSVIPGHSGRQYKEWGIMGYSPSLPEISKKTLRGVEGSGGGTSSACKLSSAIWRRYDYIQLWGFIPTKRSIHFIHRISDVRINYEGLTRKYTLTWTSGSINSNIGELTLSRLSGDTKKYTTYCKNKLSLSTCYMNISMGRDGDRSINVYV